MFPKSTLKKTLSSIQNYFVMKLKFKTEIYITSLFSITLFHTIGVYWSICYAFPVKWQTVLFAIYMYLFSGFGITGGVHRYWSHRSFEARRGVQILMMIAYSCTAQVSVYEWVKLHRLHHKFSDTDADPHNAKRGFFFSHIGWVMLKKNEEVLKEEKKIDMSDITADPMLVMQHKYFIYYKVIFGFILPTLTGIILWGENWRCAVAWQCFIRFLLVIHSELSINSFAHMYGYKPYSRNIEPVQNRFVSLCTFGEGWHNYHHTFPYDFKASEFLYVFDYTTKLIKLFSRFGWTYNLKEANPETVEAVAAKLGDGSKRM